MLMKYYKRMALALNLTVSMLLLTSCAVEKQEPVNLGTVVWVGYEPLYLGREKGFINKKEVKLVEFLSASQVLRAYRNGLIDVAALTLDEVMILLDEGFDPSIFLVMDVSNGADVILVQKKYTSFRQLKGKRIGYENTAVGAYILSRALKINNLESKDIELVSMGVNETENALINNLVDAVVTFEPIKSKLLEHGYNEVFSSREIPDEVIDVLVVRKDKLPHKKYVLKNLVNGWFKAVKYIETNKEESLTIMNKRLKLSDSMIKNAFDGVRYPARNENLLFLSKDKNKSILLNSVEKVAAEIYQMKLIKNKVDITTKFENEFLLD